MNILENYALYSSSTIDKPYIFEAFYPLPFSNYVTIHTTSKSSKNYDYWQDVVDMIIEDLAAKDIKIVQIGGKDDHGLNNVYDLRGRTDIHQTAYLIKNATAHFGADSFPVHLAGHYNKPIVALYSNNYVGCVRPYFGDKTKQFLFRNEDKKPSFSFEESPKSINQIKPETVIDACMKSLGINKQCSVKSIYFGDFYNKKLIESVPNHVIDPKVFGFENVILRADVYFNEAIIANQLSVCKCSIVSATPIRTDILQTFKANIVELIYIIDEKFDPRFVKEAQSLGIVTRMMTYLKDEALNKILLGYADYGIIFRKGRELPDKLKGLSTKNLAYGSNRYLLSAGKIYLSIAAMRRDAPVPAGARYQKIENFSVEDFADDFETGYFFSL